MAKLWDAVKWVLSSKKRVATLAAILFGLGQPLFAKLGFDVSLEQVGYVIGTLAVYVLGQGLADVGKEAKLLETKKR